MTKRLIEKRYECIRKIGEGGMAIVYEAKDSKLNRMVAVKILHEHMQHREELRERFIQEARSVSKLKHSNILEIYDFSGEKSEELWVVTELLDGIDLSKFIKDFDQRKLDPILASCIVREIALALEEAHSHGIIHRDIKPSNIMFTKQGRIKLMDFGIAKDASAGHLTQTGTFMGSPSYMSPEQIRGSGVSFSSDLYSLCVLFYELVTGRVPFRGSNTAEIITKIIEDDPIPPKDLREGLSPSINEFILKGLEKKPEYRFDHTEALGGELATILKDHGLGDSRVELEVYSKNSKAFFEKISLPPPPKQTLEIRKNQTSDRVLSNNPGSHDSQSQPSRQNSAGNSNESKSQVRNQENQVTDKKDQIKHQSPSFQSDSNRSIEISTNSVAGVNSSADSNADAKKILPLPGEPKRRSRAPSNFHASSRFSRPWVVVAFFLFFSAAYLAIQDSVFTNNVLEVVDHIKRDLFSQSRNTTKTVKTPGVEAPSAIISDDQLEKSPHVVPEGSQNQTNKSQVNSTPYRATVLDKKSKSDAIIQPNTVAKNTEKDRVSGTSIEKMATNIRSSEEKIKIGKYEPSNRRQPLDQISEKERSISDTRNNEVTVEKNVKGSSKDPKHKTGVFNQPTLPAIERSHPPANANKNNKKPTVYGGASVTKEGQTHSERTSEITSISSVNKGNSNKNGVLKDDIAESRKRKLELSPHNQSQIQIGPKLSYQTKSSKEQSNKLGQLFISANLSGELRINGKSFGNLNSDGKTYELAPGPYEIRLSKSGYKTVKGFARVEVGKLTRLIDLTMEPEYTYKLIILSENSYEVEITITSQSFVQKHKVNRGTKNIDLPTGTYNIKATAGNKILQRRISIPSPHETDGSVTFTLEMDQ